MSDEKIDHRRVSTLLREVALFLELKGENPFKIRAYSNAAKSIQTLEEDLRTVFQEGRLTEIKGVGNALAQNISELITTGKLRVHEDLKQSIPPGLLEMLKIPGLGPKKIKGLHDTLGVRTPGELEYACLENRLVELPGFGQRTQERVLQGIQQIKKYRGQHLYGEVLASAEELLKHVVSHPSVLRASLAGSLRRRMELVRNINLILSTHHPQEILTHLSKIPEVEVVQLRGKTGGHFSLSSGVEVDLQIAADQTFPFRLLRLTGNSRHWDELVGKATAGGLKLSDGGLRRNGESIHCQEEEAVFEALGLDPIPPELREGQGEIEAAGNHQLPALIEDRDVQGLFHVHSTYSDGTVSIRNMARSAKEMGHSYLGLSDHSQSARYAGGLTLDRLQKQWSDIEELNKEMEGFHIFRGIESDILPDGSLDYDEPILRQFDFVIASVHSHFNMDLEEMTQRVIKALRNPYTTILGHPTGRLLLAREPYAIDMDRILEEASRSQVVVELNAHPYRLDIDWRLCRGAKKKGIKIAIDPDAHDEEGLRDTSFGVGIARKGWLEPGDILNTLPLEEMRSFLERRKR